ncbi:MAG: helix-turn-helix transcriptional regulator [Burkholderiaceae bacterium]
MNDTTDVLISYIYDAATTDGGWENLLSFIAEDFGAVGATYFVLEKSSRKPCFWANFGHDISKEKTYTEHYINIDPTLELALESDVGKILHAKERFSNRYIERSEYFQDFLIPSRLGDVVGAKIIDRSGFVGMFSIQYDLNMRSMPDECRNMLDRVFPHLVRAAEVHLKLGRLDSRTKSLEAVLERSMQAMMIVDGSRRIQYINPAAECLVSSECGMTICGNFLRCNEAGRDMELASAIANATASAPEYPENKVVYLSRGNTQVFLSVVPMALPPQYLAHHGRLALVIASLPVPNEMEFYTTVGDLFSFTKAEKVLAYRLFAGLTLNDISDELNLSRETLRSQLHSIFVKTGTNRQGQLLSLMRQVATCLPNRLFGSLDKS